MSLEEREGRGGEGRGGERRGGEGRGGEAECHAIKVPELESKLVVHSRINVYVHACVHTLPLMR